MHRPRTNNERLFKRAGGVLVGGVNSPVRSFNAVGARPLIAARGVGAFIYDADGAEYIDYVQSFGANMLGHAPVSIIKALKAQSEKGWAFGLTHPTEITLAQLIRQAIPLAEKVRFVNSGTEAVMSAVRLARAITGRSLIVKCAHAYHGHADYLLAHAGSGLATLTIPLSEGVPKESIRHTLIIPSNDTKALQALFEKKGAAIAAVIVEPVGGNYGVLPPHKTFLKTVRRVTRAHGALMITDEIITGFRFGWGSFSEHIGIKPDIITLGKIIGGGLPIGAYCAPAVFMNEVSPCGKVYQASTFAGNPLVMVAGIAMLKALQKKKRRYDHIAAFAHQIAECFNSQAAQYSLKAKAVSYGPLFSFTFDEEGSFERFFKSVLAQGIYLAPSSYEANFVTFAHTQKHIHKTLSALRRALQSLSTELC